MRTGELQAVLGRRRLQRGVAGMHEEIAHQLQVARVVFDDQDYRHVTPSRSLVRASARRPTTETNAARSSSPFCARWLTRPESRSRSARVISLCVSTMIGTS